VIYGVYNINMCENSTFRHWYDSNVSEELRSNVLVLLFEMIFVRDGSFYVNINDAPFCSRNDIVSFISFICDE